MAFGGSHPCPTCCCQPLMHHDRVAGPMDPAEMLDKLIDLKQAHPDMTVEEMIDELGIKDDSDPPPYPGAAPPPVILQRC